MKSFLDVIVVKKKKKKPFSTLKVPVGYEYPI